MATVQTNTFLGGMDMDTDVHLIPENKYRYAENIRVITNSEGTTGVLQNIGNWFEVGGFHFPEDETVVAVNTVDNIGAALTYNYNTQVNTIYRLNVHKDSVVGTAIFKGKLGYNNSDRVKIVCNYEDQNNVKAYFAAPTKLLRSINLMSDRFVNTGTNPLLDADGVVKDNTVLDISPSAVLDQPVISEITTNGTLPVGHVQYAYALFNEMGAATTISTLSKLTPIYIGLPNDLPIKVKGADKATNSGKAFTIKINLDTTIAGIEYSRLYDKCRVYRVFYNDPAETPVVSVIGEIAVANQIGSVQFIDSGQKALRDVTVDEFNNLTNNQFRAHTIEKKDNRLFAANLSQVTWNPTYDARAYRCNSQGVVKLDSNNKAEAITFTSPIYSVTPIFGAENLLLEQLYKIPETHDCINTYNLQKSFNETADSDKFIYSPAKKGLLGGYGPNVEYEFITSDIDLYDIFSPGFKKEPYTVGPKVGINPVSPVSDLNGLIVTHDIGRQAKSYRNYRNESIVANLKGYLRDETYRFGVVMYNKQNQQSPVKWIADIRMPHVTQSVPFIANWNNDTLTGKALGINFTLRNLPADCVAVEIVRCNRTLDDRTILFQTAVSDVSTCRTRILTEEGLGNHSDIRPRLLMGMDKNKINITRQSFHTFIYPNKIVKNIFALVSPEISIAPDTFIKHMDNTYLDACYITQTRTKVMSGYDFGAMCAPSRTDKITDMTRLYDQGGTGCASGNVFTIAVHDYGEDIVSNLTPKRYFFHDGFADKKTVKLDEVVYAKPLKQNEYKNVNENYLAIGGKSYFNFAMVGNDDWETVMKDTKAGYFGRAFVAYSEGFDRNEERTSPNTMFTHISAVGTLINGDLGARNEFARVNNPMFALPIANVKRQITQYGGNSYIARSVSNYISTGTYLIKSSTEISPFVFGGDTFVDVFDNKTVSVFPLANDDDETMKLSVTDYIPFETSINVSSMYGDMTHNTSNGYHTDSLLSVDAQIISRSTAGQHQQNKPYYMYNDAYSTQSTVEQHVSKGVYDKDFTTNDTRIIVSEAKVNNELGDSWLTFRYADYLDVDRSHGKITNLKTFGDKLFFWQDSAFGVAQTNERALITDNNASPLTLGTGQLLARHDYLTTGNGSSVSNDGSIVNSEHYIYWFDYNKNEMCMFSNRVDELSKVKGVQTFLNAEVKKIQVNTAYYDNKYNEIVMSTTAGKSLVFNERLQAYTSFFTYNPNHTISTSDALFNVMPNGKIMYEYEYSEDKGLKSLIQIVVNKDATQTKVFDNVMMYGNMTEVNMLEDIKFSTKHQAATALINPFTNKYQIDYREDSYRFAIGREEKAADDMSLPGRMRGKYLICEYKFGIDDYRKFQIPSISTSYRYSLV